MGTREELIHRVTQEVMKIYNVDSDSPKGSEPSSVSGRTGTVKGNRAAAILKDTSPQEVRSALILTCGNSKLDSETVAHFKEIKTRYRQVRVLMSDNARQVFATKSRPFAGFEYAMDESGVDGLAVFDDVFVLNPTLNTLSKMAALQADNIVARTARQCLLWGKPVTILLEEIPSLPAGMMDEFNTILQKLTRYGYCFEGDAAVACAAPSQPVASPATFSGTAAMPTTAKVNPMVRDKFPVPAHSADLARMIDHTLLKAEALKPDFEKLCSEAAQYIFASVCVNPAWVKFCADRLKGSPVPVCTVIGFPLGATTPEVKAFETKNAVDNGASEIDMVINIGALKSKDYDLVKRDIEAVVKAASPHIVKVIFETALLSREEIIIACKLSKDAGAHFVKTSTGFSKGGATVEHIRLMRNAVGPDMGVKASGGVRDLATAKAMIEAGANRVGASSSVDIVTGKSASGGGY